MWVFALYLDAWDTSPRLEEFSILCACLPREEPETPFPKLPKEAELRSGLKICQSDMSIFNIFGTGRIRCCVGKGTSSFWGPWGWSCLVAMVASMSVCCPGVVGCACASFQNASLSLQLSGLCRAPSLHDAFVAYTSRVNAPHHCECITCPTLTLSQAPHKAGVIVPVLEMRAPKQGTGQWKVRQVWPQSWLTAEPLRCSLLCPLLAAACTSHADFFPSS